MNIVTTTLARYSSSDAATVLPKSLKSDLNSALFAAGGVTMGADRTVGNLRALAVEAGLVPSATPVEREAVPFGVFQNALAEYLRVFEAGGIGEYDEVIGHVAQAPVSATPVECVTTKAERVLCNGVNLSASSSNAQCGRLVWSVPADEVAAYCHDHKGQAGHLLVDLLDERAGNLAEREAYLAAREATRARRAFMEVACA